MLIYLPVVFVVFLIGILRCRVWAYWKWAIVLAVWTAVWPYLFDGGGTLDDPHRAHRFGTARFGTARFGTARVWPVRMLTVFFAFFIGILECRVWAYWKWALGLLAWVAASRAVFYLGGPGEDPADPGLILQAIRTMNWGLSEFSNAALAAFAAYCAVVAFFIWRMILAFRQHRRQRADRAVTDASTVRKLLEVAALCLGLAAVITFDVGNL